MKRQDKKIVILLKERYIKSFNPPPPHKNTLMTPNTVYLLSQHSHRNCTHKGRSGGNRYIRVYRILSALHYAQTHQATCRNNVMQTAVDCYYNRITKAIFSVFVIQFSKYISYTWFDSVYISLPIYQKAYKIFSEDNGN